MEGPEGILDRFARDVADDENEAGAAVAVGPAIEMQWRMHEVLDAIDHDRRGAVADIEDALDAQHVGAVGVEEHGQPDAEDGPVDRAVEGHGEGMDARIMAAGVAMMMSGMVVAGVRPQPTTAPPRPALGGADGH